MKPIVYILFLLFVAILPAWAQGGPDTLWTRTYGGTGNDWCYSVQQVGDDGLIMAGQSNSFGPNLHNVLVIRTDLMGDTLWTRTYGGTGNDAARAIRHVSSGGFIIAGSTFSYGAGLSDIYLIRIEDDGDTLWTRTFGGPASDYGRSVVETPDGGFAVAGITNSFGAGSSDAYLVKTDDEGNLEWSHTYGTSFGDEARTLQVTGDGGLILGGAAWREGSTWSDALIIRTTALGDTLWTRRFGDTEQDWVNSIVATRDGAYVAAGQSWLPGSSNPDIYLLRVSDSGDLDWSQLLTGPGADEAHSIVQTVDGGFLAVGYTAPIGTLATDYYMVKTDSLGSVLWVRTYGGEQPDVAYSAIQTENEGFVIGGESQSFGAGLYDIFVVATGAAPQAGDTVRDLRVQYYPSGDGIVLFWTVPRAGDYNIYSTILADLPPDPSIPGWNLEGTVNFDAGLARWVDPSPLANLKAYIVTRDYGLLLLRQSRAHRAQR